MKVNYVAIGERIRAIRKKRGIPQSVLAEKIEISPTFISYIEGGRKIMSLETFLMIANSLNASADELLADNLENTVKVSNHEFADLLADCTEYEKRVMFDVAFTTKQSMRNNRSLGGFGKK